MEMIENNGILRIEIPADTSVRHYLKKNGIALIEPCRGQGRCGRCLIRVVKGSLPAGLREVYALPEKAVAQGYRMGCQAVTRDPVTMKLRRMYIAELKRNSHCFKSCLENKEFDEDTGCW